MIEPKHDIHINITVIPFKIASRLKQLEIETAINQKSYQEMVLFEASCIKFISYS